MDKKYYWFSFSYEGKNQGVCSIEAESDSIALSRLWELKIAPKFDHIMGFELTEQEIELDVLISPEDMKKRGYKSSGE